MARSTILLAAKQSLWVVCYAHSALLREDEQYPIVPSVPLYCCYKKMHRICLSNASVPTVFPLCERGSASIAVPPISLPTSPRRLSRHQLVCPWSAVDLYKLRAHQGTTLANFCTKWRNTPHKPKQDHSSIIAVGSSISHMALFVLVDS